MQILTPRLLWMPLLLAASIDATAAVALRVTVENLAPAQGTHMSPLWVGFHDGSFDIYDAGTMASMAVERIAEDGNSGPLGTDLMTSGNGSAGGFFPPMPPVAPGDRFSAIFVVDSLSAMSRYFSYAAMVVPSNDAFIANGDPMAHQVFDVAGNLLPLDILVLGTGVLDAGTEDNDEVPGNTALLGQMVPDTGMPENGVVAPHGGFTPNGNILSAFPNADFTQPGYRIARITVEQVPEPGTWILMLSGLAAAAAAAKFRTAGRG